MHVAASPHEQYSDASLTLRPMNYMARSAN
jgi:hypothetical protein